ncbi:DNA-binding protein [Mycobacterium paragordonae]|uniref:helix-turn-helix domain-containing protein n=1 Tax=Mycobacterium paragordonae TaxID=1389713 RepID=UPI001061BC85|nr:helix-turn-helix domain-containing protein [Mycobacterium paragordonae]TDK88370.1 DNA-binding protein [Mycobacterium paragordonae]
MAEIFVLEPATADESVDRIPEGLPVGSPERRTLERALQRAGLAIVPVDAVIDSADVGATSSDRRRLRASVAAVVDAATDAELVRLESAVVSDSGDDLDESFWGPAPDSVTASKAVFADLTDQFAQRRRLAADSISRDEAAELLDVAAQSVTAKLATRKLVGMKIGREWRLPVWQFEPEAPSGVLPDLDQLQAAFPGGLISLSRWMLCGHAEFDGRTPRDEMLLHGSAPVIAVARALTAAGW